MSEEQKTYEATVLRANYLRPANLTEKNHNCVDVGRVTDCSPTGCDERAEFVYIDLTLSGRELKLSGKDAKDARVSMGGDWKITGQQLLVIWIGHKRHFSLIPNPPAPAR